MQYYSLVNFSGWLASVKQGWLAIDYEYAEGILMRIVFICKFS